MAHARIHEFEYLVLFMVLVYWRCKKTRTNRIGAGRRPMA